MNLLNFNSNNKSWKMYTNMLTSINNDDLLIKPNNTNNLILEVSANNNIFLKKGDISYSINTKFDSIDTSFSNVYTTFSAITSSFGDVNTKFLLIDASFNSKLASISGSIVPLNDICYNLGVSGKMWANAYIRDISVTNISASGNIIPLLNPSGSLGVSTNIWANAFIKDISGLVNINGQPYGSGSGTGNIDLTNVTTNINPSIDNSGSLGIATRKWRNAFISDLSVGSIDVSVNLNPISIMSGSGGIVTRINEYVYHVYRSIGTSTFTALSSGTVEALLVGGGGGGGASLGSGGGGGGVIWLPSVRVSAGQNYNIVVGAGGSSGTNGGTTTCFDASAAGGGRGIGYQTSPGFGISGGSGSGAVIVEAQNSTLYTGGGGKVGNSIGLNISGFSYGERGGNIVVGRSGFDPLRQAGGGGAGAQGFDTNSSITDTTTQTGQSSGGQGILNTIYLGLNYYWGGGGGGAAYTVSGINSQGGWGGLGGGGGGSTSTPASSLGGIGGGSALVSGSNGTAGGAGGAGGANTGGGGGGGAWSGLAGGAGGSGIVVIRYLSYANVNLGASNRLWGNAYIRDLSVSSIDVSVSINPLINNRGSLGVFNDIWGNAYIRDLSVSSIDVSVNLNPFINNNGSLGISNDVWGNAYIRNISATSITISGSLLPLTNNTGSLGTALLYGDNERYLNQVAMGRTFLSLESSANAYYETSGVGIVIQNPNLTSLANQRALLFIRSSNSSVNSRAGVALDISGKYGWQISVRQNSPDNGTLYFNSSSSGTNATDAVYFTASGNLVFAGTLTVSDDRLKHNEIIINNGLAIIDQLTPKFYQKTLVMLDAHYNGDLSDYTWFYEAGLIAQELLQTDISFVVQDGDYYDSNNVFTQRPYVVNYTNIYVYGLAAIKELHAKVKIQDSIILNLQATILNQQTTIDSLIAELEALENKI